MSITISKDTLSRVIGAFQIQKDDTQARSIAKFASGTALKTAVMGLAGFEYITASMGSFLPIRSATCLTEYANEAADTFAKAASSMNRPFAPTTRVVSKWCGFKKEIFTEEGRSVTSYMNNAKQMASKNKGLIATGVILAAAAITLYYFGPRIFSTAVEAQPLPVKDLENLPAFGPENMPKFGPENLPAFGPENMPKFGPENLPAFGPENMPKFGPENLPVFGPENVAAVNPPLSNPFLGMSPTGEVCPLTNPDIALSSSTSEAITFTNSPIPFSENNFGSLKDIKIPRMPTPSFTPNNSSFPLFQGRTPPTNASLSQIVDRDVVSLKAPTPDEIPSIPTIAFEHQSTDFGRTRIDDFSQKFTPNTVSMREFLEEKITWVQQKASQSATKVISSVPFSGIAAAGIAFKNPQHTQNAMLLGVSGSIFEAIALRLWKISDPAADLGEKLSKCGQYANFAFINGLKQLELKTFALFSATVPFLINLAVGKARGEDIRAQFSRKNLVYYGTLFLLSLSNPLYGNFMGLTSRSGFDSSGHAMLKTALVPAVGTAMAKTAEISPILGGALTSAYLVTDSIFMKNTALFCHTAEELKWGLGWGAGILAISSLASRIFG